MKTTEVPKEVQKFEVYAWVGRDELGTGVFGLKQGIVPAGTIPMVSLSREKLEKYWSQAEAQAQHFGQRIYLVKMAFSEVIQATECGN